MTNWCHGYTTNWCHSYTISWCHGYTTNWCHGYTTNWCHGYTTTWCHGYITNWCHGYTTGATVTKQTSSHSYSLTVVACPEYRCAGMKHCIQICRSQGRASLYYFYSKNNQMHQCIKFTLFCDDILHVSDGLSVHHQQFKTVHTAVKQILLSVCCLTNACCCICSFELLMMDGKTVRNMQSVISK